MNRKKGSRSRPTPASGRRAPKQATPTDDLEQVRFRVKLADEALARRGWNDRRLEEARRALRPLHDIELPQGEVRDRLLWLMHALDEHRAGERISSTAMTWLRRQVSDLRTLMS